VVRLGICAKTGKLTKQNAGGTDGRFGKRAGKLSFADADGAEEDELAP